MQATVIHGLSYVASAKSKNLAAAKALVKAMTTKEAAETEAKNGTAIPAFNGTQQAWIESDAIQCGYCQSGQILAAVDLLRRKPRPGEDDLAAIANLCRCGSQPQLRRAIARAAAILRGERK